MSRFAKWAGNVTDAASRRDGGNLHGRRADCLDKNGDCPGCRIGVADCERYPFRAALRMNNDELPRPPGRGHTGGLYYQAMEVLRQNIVTDYLKHYYLLAKVVKT
jgi:hypothetical protein